MTDESVRASAIEKAIQAARNPVGFAHHIELSDGEAELLQSDNQSDTIRFGEIEVLFTADCIWRES